MLKMEIETEFNVTGYSGGWWWARNSEGLEVTEIMFPLFAIV
jgi:hypothetical protein